MAISYDCGVVGNIAVFGVLTRYALFNSVFEFKSHMNERATESNSGTYVLGMWSKNIYCVRADDHSTVTRWLKKFHLGHNNLANQTRSSRPKKREFQDLFQIKDVSGE